MIRVVQIAPAVATGSGVEAVAWHLEQEFTAAGVMTERFTMTEAGGDWLPSPGGGVAGKLALAARVVWFSTVGTVRARRFLAARPEAVSLCHNDVLAGDVYVNHGILTAAMQARGRYALRMLRNPLHLFTAARDRLRYRSAVHRTVVNLTQEEADLLRRTYPRLRPRPVVIGNGVDVNRYRPPSAVERAQARRELSLAELPPDALTLVFVGHEFDRKGLPLVLEALSAVDRRVGLLVAGGTPDMVAEAQRLATRHGVADRVRLLGRLTDPIPAFWAADAFVLPSAYESYGLVVLEALACGLPVLVTPTGCVPDVVTEGANGWLVERSAESIAAAIEQLLSADRSAVAEAARASALPHSWPQVARAYLDLLTAVRRAEP